MIYQKERFPLPAHGPLITIFTFSAISYSRICRKQDGFIPIQDFVIGIFATITLFLLVRIFDEFKDKKEDALYRKYLPVPRGLVSLSELKKLGWVVAITQVLIITLFQPRMLGLYCMVLLYLLLMRVEFFIPEYLKKHQLLYITSHMVIIPLIDIYSSGLDWLLGNAAPHQGLIWFFAVSYMNGLVLEFGRKMRTEENEECNVISYTGLYGRKGAPLLWIGTMFITMMLSIGAVRYAGLPAYTHIIFISIFLICSLPGWLFIIKSTVTKSKWMEYASAAWTMLLYFFLGGIPMCIKLFQSL